MAENDVHIYVHFDPIIVSVDQKQPAGPAVGLVMTIGPKEAPPMPHTINIDTKDETATIQFVDGHGNPTAAPPTYGSFAFTFSDGGASLAATPNDAASDLPNGKVKVDLVPTGTPAPDPGITVSAQPLDTNGQPLLEADGVTPFPAVSGDAPIIVNPGAAQGERLELGPA